MAAEAPRQDLEFLQKLYAYRNIDKAISLIAVKKIATIYGIYRQKRQR